MAAYRFLTHWHIPAPVERVWPLLDDLEHYGRWWPAFIGYKDLTPGLHGVGGRAEQLVRGVLPYTLRYVTTVTAYEPAQEVAFDVVGDLAGDGRYVLEPKPDGTHVTIYWNVATSGLWLNLLAPLLKPLFAWNHNWVMNQGERGLTAHLRERASGNPSGDT